jgi:hypothetical protein
MAPNPSIERPPWQMTMAALVMQDLSSQMRLDMGCAK